MKRLPIFLLLLPIVHGAETGVLFEKTLDKSTVGVGEPVTISLYVENNGDYSIEDIEVTDSASLPGINYHYLQYHTILLPNSSMSLKPFTFSPLMEGNYTLPPAKLEFYDPVRGQKIQIKTGEIRLEVLSRPPANASSTFITTQDVRNTSQERFLYPKTITKERPALDWAAFSILGFALIAFLCLVAYAYMKKEKVEPVASKPPPRDLTKERLIEAKSLFYSGDTICAFDIISDEVRRLIREKYSIEEELTNKEYVAFLKDRGLDEKPLSQVKHTLDFCDLVKFAGYKPDSDEFLDTVYMAEDVKKYFSELPD